MLLWTVLLVLFANASSSAQSGISAQIQIDPFPSPYLSDWQANPNIGFLSLSNDSTESVQIRLFVTLIEQQRGLLVGGSSRLFTFPPGTIEAIATPDFLDYSSVEYDDSIEEIAVRTGRLPEGVYSICVQIQDQNGIVFISNVCATFTIVYPDPPYLIFPFDGDSVRSEFPIFQWTPVQTPVGFPVRYALRIVELLSGQVQLQALDANVTHYENFTIPNPSLQYPLDALEMTKGKSYVWQVQALDDDGYPPATNEGKSEIWSFVYDIDTTAPPEPVSLSGIVRDSASGLPLAGARIVYQEIRRKITGEDTTWQKQGDSAVVLSGGDGRYLFTDRVDQTFYSLIISHHGYSSLSLVGEGFFQDGNKSGLEHKLSLTPLGNRRITGIVRDLLTNEPVPNMPITYRKRKLSFKTGRFGLPSGIKWTNIGRPLQTISDADGNFVFSQTADSSFFSLSTPENQSYFGASEQGMQVFQAGDIDGYVLLLRPKSSSVDGSLLTVVGSEEVPVSGEVVHLSQSLEATVHLTSWKYMSFPFSGGGLWIKSHDQDKTIRQSVGNGMSVYSDQNGYFRFDNVQLISEIDIAQYETAGPRFRTEAVQVGISKLNTLITVNNPRFRPYETKGITILPGQLSSTGEHILEAKKGSIAGSVVSGNSPIEGALVRLYAWTSPTGQGSSGKSGNNSQSEGSGVQPVDSGAWGGNNGNILGEPINFAVTDSNGNYTIASVIINDPVQQTDKYLLKLTSEFHHGATQYARLETDGQKLTKDFDIRAKLAIVEGTVTDIGGAPLSMMKTVLQKKGVFSWDPGNPVFYLTKQTETGGDGSYTFSDVDTGLYRVVSYTSRHNRAISDSFQVTNGLTVSVSIVRPATKGTLVGTIVSSNGDPLPNASIKSDDLPIFLTTGNDGKFTIDKLPTGDISLFFSSYNHKDDTATYTILANDTVETEIKLERFTGRYRARVVDKATDKALPNMEVSLGNDLTKTTNFDGKVVFDNVNVGHYKLSVKPPESGTFDKDYVPFSTEVTVKHTVGTAELLVELVPGARLSGTVVDADSARPVAGVSITVEGNDKITSKTDSKGAYVLRNIPAGRPLTLIATKPGYKVARLSKNWSITAGDHIKNVRITLESSPIDSLFGFAIVVDSIWKATGSNKYVTGSIVNMKNSFGLALAEVGASIPFEKVLVDASFKPTKLTISLSTKEIKVKLFNFEGVMSAKTGLELEWLDSLGVGRLSGAVTLWDQSSMVFPLTKLSNMTIPREKAPSFWSDGVNRGLQKYGITATDTELQATFKGVTLAIDYIKSNIDTAGFHFYGSISLGEKLKVGMEEMLIGFNDQGRLDLKSVTLLTDPVIKVPFYAFTLYDSAMTWDNTGFWARGSIEMTRLGGREFGVTDLHISSNGDFLSSSITADDENGLIEVYGQKFTIESITMGTDNWDIDTVDNVRYFALTGNLALTGLDKPVTFQNLKYTDDDQFYGTIGFNQTTTLKKVVSLTLEEIVFDTSEAGKKFVGVTGAIKFGAIKGLSAQAGNLRFFSDGSLSVDELGFGFYAGPTQAQLRIRWTDTEFEGDGMLKVPPQFNAGAEFRYAGDDDWWIKIISGTRIPMGTTEIVNASGGIGRENDTWRFSIGGTLAPARSEKGMALDLLAEVYKTPQGIIIYGEGDVTVGGSLGVGRATLKLDLPNSRLDGSIILAYDNEALTINGQVDIGSKFGKNWYVHGRANANFLQFFSATGLVVFAENWDYFYAGESRVINGYLVDVRQIVAFDGRWANISWGANLNQHGWVLGDWAGTQVQGGVGVSASAYGNVSFGVLGDLRASGGFSLEALLVRDSQGFRAQGTASAVLRAKVRDCTNDCWKICWDCVKRVKYVGCVWKLPGGTACLNMSANVKYSSQTGTSVNIRF